MVLASYLTSIRNPEIMVDGGFSVTHLINYCLQMNNSKHNNFFLIFLNCAGSLHYLFTFDKNFMN